MMLTALVLTLLFRRLSRPLGPFLGGWRYPIQIRGINGSGEAGRAAGRRLIDRAGAVSTEGGIRGVSED